MWRTLKLGTPSNRQFFNTNLGEQLLVKYAHHIQELEVHSPPLLRLLFNPPASPNVLPRWHRLYHVDLASVRCPLLRKLTVHAKLRRDRSVPKDPATLARSLVRFSPRLRTLEMMNVRQRAGVRQDLLLASRNLKHLRIDFPMLPLSVRGLLRCVPKSIQTINMSIDQYPEDGHESSDDEKNDKYDKGNQILRQVNKVKKMRQHKHLKSLHLPDDFSGWEEDVLLPFVNSCKKGVFKDFKVKDTFCYSTSALVDAFAKLGMYLDCFQDTDPPSAEDSEDYELAEVISVNPRLELIFFSKVETAGPLTVAAIMKCKHLKSLDLQGCRNLSSQDVLQILGSAQILEQFWAMTNLPSYAGEHAPRDPWIAAADMSEAVWGMNKLTTFNCSIKAPRPRYQVPMSARQDQFEASLELSHLAQRAAYRHLALQTDLDDLVLGHGASYYEKGLRKPHFQWYSLEMTLESGLDELAHLTEMKTLDVGFMNHRIGVAELEWMQRSWPKLNYLYGLFWNGKERDPLVEEWIETHRPNWVMTCDDLFKE
ncbi:hypothetical protein CPB97_010765 [Podila verticillata]|nr:hypothetical protein CPB97_010765 [Podila verticillata]